MNPYPDQRSVLVLDNCRIHHNDALVDLVTAAGLQFTSVPLDFAQICVRKDAYCFICRLTRLITIQLKSLLAAVRSYRLLTIGISN
jgi:hypothetical protein